MQENYEILGMKILSGEIVIARVMMDQTVPGVVFTECPLSLEYTQGANGPSLGMRPFIPFAKSQEFAFNADHIQGTFEPADEIVDNYKKIVTKLTTGIVVPEKSIILG